MKDNFKEPKLTYALDSSGKMVHISNVERGIACNCRCPECNELLTAKRGNGRRQPHFAHQKDSDCHGSYMSALHKLAEQIIEDEMAVMVPAYKGIDKQKLEFEKVEVEQRVERKDLQPDLVGITSDGLRWFIEIRNTHEVDEAKRAKLRESNISCLEIDVREQTLENLKSFLLESPENREWINNPNYESQIAEAKRKRVSQVERFLLESEKLRIPKYGNTDTHIINFKEVTMLSKSDDGLYVRLKVITSDDVSYVFNIGSHDIIETTKVSLKHDCNELVIFIDNISQDTVITIDTLNVKWIYNFATEKEEEAKIMGYMSNPQYELRPMADCETKCEYRPFWRKCIYLKERISQHGVDYVVCNKARKQKDIETSSLGSQDNSRYLSDVDNDRETYYSWKPTIWPKHKEHIQHSFKNSLEESHPIETFNNIDDYYEHLLMFNSYNKKGHLAEILKCNIKKNRIIVLYKVPKHYTPYHIDIITAKEEKLIPDEVAVFDNDKKAFNNYYERLRAMSECVDLKRSEEIGENDLPF